MQMRLDDFLVLGRTVPEASRHYGVRVCMAGYSEELGRLLRIYPLLIDAPLRARHLATMEVIRNPDDNRRESFNLRDAVDSIYAVSDAPHWSVGQVCDLASHVQARSIAQLNALKVSLGYIPLMQAPELVWCTRPEKGSDVQLMLFDEFVHDLHITQFWTGTAYPQVPYLRLKDADGEHTLQL